MNIKYPVYQPKIGAEEKALVMECLDTTWISSKGKFINEFETEFSQYVGVKHSTAVSNGTVALHLALEGLGIGPGDEVLVPSFTYIASVNAIQYTSATPVFIDSDPKTWQLDWQDAKRKITPKTKAIMVVHLYGYPCDMENIIKLAKEKNLLVIEDCAEAFGSRLGSKHCGTFGDVATFSFFGNKTITTGEGGMVSSNDPDLHRKMVKLKGQGLAHKQYWHDVVGYNYRMTNICAAIGVAQLRKADGIIKAKREIAQWYKTFLANLPVEMLWEAPNMTNSFWMISVKLKNEKVRDELRTFLDQFGIETRPSFYPVHTMPMYEQKLSLPGCDEIAYSGMNFPSYPELKEADVKFICDHVAKFFNQA